LISFFAETETHQNLTTGSGSWIRILNTDPECGSLKPLNTDPMRIRIRNTAVNGNLTLQIFIIFSVFLIRIRIGSVFSGISDPHSGSVFRMRIQDPDPVVKF